MIEALALDTNNACAELPPKTFHIEEVVSQVEFLSSSGWEARPKQDFFLWKIFSSSANTWEEMFDSWAYQAQTSSSPQPFTDDDNQARLDAIARSKSVDRQLASENVFEIRRMTGFSWSAIGELLNVDRRTITNWAQGKPIKEANKDQIALVLSALRYVDRGDVDSNQDLLKRILANGETAIATLAKGNAALVKRALSFGEPKKMRLGRPEFVAPSTSTLSYHEGADGTEVSEPLAFEAKPASKKKKLKRS